MGFMRANVLFPCVALLLAACGGGNPIYDCPDAPDRDCCTENAQCLEYYEGEFDYCVGGSSAGGGVCSECSRDDHCASNNCEIIADFGVCI